MVKRIALGVSLFVSLTLTGCQSYTSGIQQTIARADETVITSTLRAITVAERAYSLTNSGEYGSLQQLAEGGFLDAKYATARPIPDYNITLNVTPKAPGAPEGSFTCNADPASTTQRAGRHFYVDSNSNAVHVNDTKPASADDPSMQ